MLSEEKRLTAIYNFGMMTGQNPWFAFLTGYLAGQVHRVWFVQDLKGAEIAVRLCIRRTAIWPNEPFRARVRGVSMPNPFTMVRSIDREDTPICLNLDFDHAEDTPWYQEVLLPNASYVKDPDAQAKEESDALWEEMDRTLDIYRECRSLVQKDPERKKELQYYLQIAETEMKRLTREMEKLNERMKQLDGNLDNS
jgi:uncharacterized protein YpiB (UPF0302 family)